jgi:hypothetical protein
MGVAVRGKQSLWVHLLLLITTAGVGNVIYWWVKTSDTRTSNRFRRDAEKRQAEWDATHTVVDQESVETPDIPWPYPFLQEPMVCRKNAVTETATGEIVSYHEQYIATPNNLEHIRRELEQLNSYLDVAKSLTPSLPTSAAIDTRLVRTHDPARPFTANDLLDYASFLVERSTKTGRVPKYPLTLQFGAYSKTHVQGPATGVHGTISYLASGSPGKIWLVCWVNGGLTTVDCKIIDGEMSVAYVKTKDANGRDVHLYDYRKASA